MVSQLIFQVSELPDLKSQKYIAIHGQETRRKALSIQKDFLLLLSDLSQTYNLTLSITYQYHPNAPADRKLAIYLSISQPQITSNQKLSADIEKIVTQGFLSQFYSIQRLKDPTIPILTRTDWVQYIGETIKYEEVITTRAKDSLDKYKKGLPNYYLPLQLEADENNDMLVVCEAISSFNSPIVLQITLEPDIATIKEKSSWINALDQMLSQLKQASSGSGLSSNREGDRNAQLVSRIYEKYQTTYLTESLYCYSFKAIGIDELAIRSILGTLLLSGTKKSRYRTLVIDRTHPQFAASLSASQNNTLHLGTHWSEWDQGLGAAEFGGDSITGKDSVRVADLKPLHRYATLNEISGLFRIVVPGDAPVKGIARENDIPSLSADRPSINFGGYEPARPEYPIQIDLAQLNKHAFICGVPGSGKTTTAFNILTELWFQDIPFLVFEPAKTEYRSLLNLKPDTVGAASPSENRFNPQQLSKLQQLTANLRVYTLGNDTISPFRFNPFAVSADVPFFEHIGNLEASFRGALPLSGPLPALLSEALEEIYYDRQWTGRETGTPEHLSIPTMGDLYEKITALFETKDYAGEVKSNLKTALEVRIGSLLRRGVGAMLNTQQSSPSIADLLKYPTIIELDYLNQDQANLMTFLLLTKIREYIKRQRTEGSGVPEHVILLEEAHNLVGRNLGANPDEANTKQEAANYVTRMLAEMRALREGIIIADQLPTAVAAEVVKNTNIKIAHRLVSADDRKEIGQAMLLDGSQMEEIARLNTGESFLYMEGWYRPHLVKIPLENSAKTKLGIENSITSAQIATLIQPQAWYRQSQATLLATALQEHTRLYQKYNQTFSSIRAESQQINKTCENLRSALTTLTKSVFYRLTGELKLELDPLPNDEPALRSDKRLDASNLRSLKNLQPSPHLTLKDLLELRSNLTEQLAEFDRTYQSAITANNRIPRQKYQQQWQSLHRQINTVYYQITDLATILHQPDCLPVAQQQLAEIDYTQQLINSREEPTLRKTFEQLDIDCQSLQDKLMVVLNRAIEQAKINKAIHDLNLGGL
jgi:DNA helicase HerA-like ATPase